MRKPLDYMDILVLTWYTYMEGDCPLTKESLYKATINMLLKAELLYDDPAHGYMATAKGEALVKNILNTPEPKQYWK